MRKLLRYVAILQIVLALYVTAVSQEKFEASFSIPKAWTSPPFEGLVIKSARGDAKTIDGKKVTTCRHILKSEIFVSAMLCGENNEGKTIIDLDPTELYGVKSYTSYRFGGKTFAYHVEYDLIVEAQERVGATLAGVYVDHKGEGTFELTCVKNFEPDTIPKWLVERKQ